MVGNVTLYRRKKCKGVIRPDTKLYIYILECFKRFWSPEIIAHSANNKGFHVLCIYIPGIKGKRNYKVCQENCSATSRKKYIGNRKKFCTIHPVPHIRQTGNCRNKIPYKAILKASVYGGIGKGCAVTFVDRKSKLLVGSITISQKNTIEKLSPELLNLWKFLCRLKQSRWITVLVLIFSISKKI